MSSRAFARPAAALAAALALAPACIVAAQGADSCAAPQPVKGYGTFAFDSAGATTDGAADVLCNFFSQQNIFNDLWFAFTASETTVVDVTNCGATALDTKIAIYGGADCASPVIACSDDNCATQTKVTFGAQAGQSYLIRIGSYNAAQTGSGTFTISPFVPLADIIDPVSGNRYVAFSATTWTSAEAFSQQLGGHLVSINTQAEQDFVWQNFGNLGGVDRRVWIGFSDAASEGAFGWSDGTVAKYTNWNPGEPNNSGGVEHYAELLGSNGQWNDLNNAGSGFAHIAVAEILGSGGGGSCPADLTGDLVVDAQDIASLLSGWGTPSGDITGDGATDAQDIAALLSAWGSCPL
jgi:hypothetical protein